MGLFSWISRRSSSPKPRPFEEVIARLDSMFGTASGQVVTATTALQVSTVLACVKVIADGVATPELRVYRVKGKEKRELATNIPEFRLLNRRPNEFQTSIEFRRQMTLHAALTGNALAIKVRSPGSRRVRELIPVAPNSWILEEPGRYEHTFRVWDRFGQIGVFGPDDVLHIPNYQWDEIKALDAVVAAREAIGLSIAAQNTQSTLHQNGGRPAGVLTTDSAMGAEAIERLREAWRQFTSNNRNGTAILDNGFKYTPLAVTGVDSQHLETRRFQVEEICRAFGVFPIMIGHSDKASTFASSEAFFAAHVKHTLAPWLTLWSQRLDEFVLDGAGPLWCEFDTRYLLAGSMKDRAVWARTMVEMGIYTRNEVRDEEGKDPLPGLDEPLTPLNMTGATPEPADPAADPAADDEEDSPNDPQA